MRRYDKGLLAAETRWGFGVRGFGVGFGEDCKRGFLRGDGFIERQDGGLFHGKLRCSAQKSQNI